MIMQSWMGFDPGFKRPMCLATLKSSDRTNSLSVDDNIYIYIEREREIDRDR